MQKNSPSGTPSLDQPGTPSSAFPMTKKYPSTQVKALNWLLRQLNQYMPSQIYSSLPKFPSEDP